MIDSATIAVIYKHGAIALLGAITHSLLAYRNGTVKTILDFVSLIIISSFCGVMFTLLGLHLFPSSPYLGYAMSGAGGYLGVEGMAMIVAYLKKTIAK